MEQPTPLVTVVMTTYNDSLPVLQRAIDSILAQTFADLEFIIVFEPDDRNHDLVRLNYDDPRLILVRSQTQAGMAASFNIGLSMARGRYIARMDSDDFAYPIRLEMQIKHLQAHRELSLVGAAGRLLDEHGNALGFRQFPTAHDDIVRHFALTNPIFHPTVMWDRAQIGYDVRYDPQIVQEDTELWLRLLTRGHRFANLPDVLIDYTQPANYQRPPKIWRGGLRARLKHWRLGLRHPFFFVGIAMRCAMLLLPTPLMHMMTERNRLSDRLRSIRSRPQGPAANNHR